MKQLSLFSHKINWFIWRFEEFTQQLGFDILNDTVMFDSIYLSNANNQFSVKIVNWYTSTTIQYL